MSDIIANIGSSILQHGKYNDRIYLMKLSNQDFPDIIDDLEKLASTKNYSKIFAKVPGYARREFEKNGYMVEASIPQFYNGHEDVYFMGKFFYGSRRIDEKIEEINEILKNARSYAHNEKKSETISDLPHDFIFKICDISDAYQVSELYSKVFKTYPFPIHDPSYIMKTMNENFIYFCIRRNNMIVALSSSEMDIAAQNVEMTDFATLPEYRGNGFAIYLLYKMEEEMRKKQMKTVYTISRAVSHGINIIFAKMGYKYGGTLLNNTNISGNLESMNVWYKSL